MFRNTGEETRSEKNAWEIIKESSRMKKMVILFAIFLIFLVVPSFLYIFGVISFYILLILYIPDIVIILMLFVVKYKIEERIRN